MNSQRYLEILEDQIHPISYHLGDPSSDWLYMDDNAPPHRSLLIRNFKQQSGLRTIDWPAMSPDLNPIENVWSLLKKNVRRRLKATDDIQSLKDLLKREWDNLSQTTIDSIIESMPSRVRSVIGNSGGNTKY